MVRFVALVSGGKDSVLSAAYAAAAGHTLACMANLRPANTSTQELDSHMYQTVAHGALDALPACVGVPMYRRGIVGGSCVTTLQYERAEGEARADEVEDLYLLLRSVVRREAARGIDIRAVSVGAVASDYQRLRVEDVCGRLGLTVLCYLWLRPQPQLLDDMVTCGLHAVLVKIAAFGITLDMLGQTLAEARDKLQELGREYGCHPCGEGGEYETLALDLPALFTHARLVLDETQRVIVEKDKFAPVAHLIPTKVRVEPKESARPAPADAVVVCVDADEREPEPEGTESAADAAAAHLGGVSLSEGCVGGVAVVDALPRGAPGHAQFRSFEACGTPRKGAGGEATAALASGGDGGTVQKYTAEDVADSVRSALLAIGEALAKEGLGWRDAVYVHLYLSDMGAFATANKAYIEHINHKNPPARACVQAKALPEGALAAVEVTTAMGAREGREVLHVQSVSYWAAACIGPYAQAAAMHGLWHIAGQIGLVPHSMELAEGARLQARHAAANASAVAERVGAPLHRCMTECCVYVSAARGDDARACADEGGAALAALCFGEAEARRPGPGPFGWGDGVGAVRHPPLYGSHREWWPATTFVALSVLPKGALVEITPVAAQWLAEDDMHLRVRDWAWRTPPPQMPPKSPRDIGGMSPPATARDAARAHAHVDVDVDCRGAYVPGRLASLRSVATAAAPPPSGASHAQMGEHAAHALCDALQAAELSPADVMCLRVYAVGDWAAAAATAAAVERALGGSVHAAPVAAAAVGGHANMTADVAVVVRAVRAAPGRATGGDGHGSDSD